MITPDRQEYYEAGATIDGVERWVASRETEEGAARAAFRFKDEVTTSLARFELEGAHQVQPIVRRVTLTAAFGETTIVDSAIGQTDAPATKPVMEHQS